jgi:hypothetical protein
LPNLRRRLNQLELRRHEERAIEDIEVRLADLEEAAETPKQNGRS